MLVNSKLIKTFDHILRSHGTQNMIKLPNRVTTDSSTLIDLFSTKHEKHQIKAGVSAYDITDHLTISYASKQQKNTPNFA